MYCFARFFLWKLLIVLLEEDWQDSYCWPLLVFLLSCCLYPLASSCAHTFSTMSERARHICFFFDYGALSFYSLGQEVGINHVLNMDLWKWINYVLCQIMMNCYRTKELFTQNYCVIGVNQSDYLLWFLYKCLCINRFCHHILLLYISWEMGEQRFP